MHPTSILLHLRLNTYASGMKGINKHTGMMLLYAKHISFQDNTMCLPLYEIYMWITISYSTCQRQVQPAPLKRENINYVCKATNWLWHFPVKPQPNVPLLTDCQASACLRQTWIIFFFSVQRVLIRQVCLGMLSKHTHTHTRRIDSSWLWLVVCHIIKYFTFSCWNFKDLVNI